MASNDGYARVATRFGEVGLLSPLQADVALVHAPLADRAGNIVLHPPLLEGVWGALGARRGAIVTAERIVDDIRPWSHLVRIPAHRVLAVVECPLGAHRADAPDEHIGNALPAQRARAADQRRETCEQRGRHAGTLSAQRRSTAARGTSCHPRPWRTTP